MPVRPQQGRSDRYFTNQPESYENDFIALLLSPPESDQFWSKPHGESLDRNPAHLRGQQVTTLVNRYHETNDNDHCKIRHRMTSGLSLKSLC